MADITFDSLDQVPEDLRDGAKAGEDGKVTLDLVPNSKLKEFRENNITISKERDALKVANETMAKIIGEDVDAFSTELEELRSTKQQVDDGKLKKNEDIESALASRTEQMKTAHVAALEEKGKETAAWQERALKAEDKLRGTLVDRAIRDAALKDGTGVLTSALDDIVARGKTVFAVDENENIVAMSGKDKIYGADGTTPLSPDEWLQGLKKTAGHFFERSAGGGAEGGNKDVPGGMDREAFNNLPAQERLKLARKHGATA